MGKIIYDREITRAEDLPKLKHTGPAIIMGANLRKRQDSIQTEASEVESEEEEKSD
ncbi:hypothetical protein RJ527_09015 [Thalassospiraceae bacterium LMO-SO8]|nr:hypothetical protein [Alphaproteobacteria bacterium LMO-S08]WND77871.1 hypothetical protein RJ527_09015 [Thalassospiraceae bacterium LMO-SO8]